MRKSNWIILAVLVIASIFFLWLWYYLKFDLVDHPRDLILSIIWWVVVVAACVGIHYVERIRQRNIRTAYLAPGLIYNSEAGIVRFQPPVTYVDELQEILSNLKYNFERPDEPNQKRVRFTYIVRSAKFADDGDKWEGEVVQVSRPDDPQPFSGREQLAVLLGIKPEELAQKRP